MAQFSDEETPGILFLELLGIRMDENEKVKDFIKICINLINRIPINRIEEI